MKKLKSITKKYYKTIKYLGIKIKFNKPQKTINPVLKGFFSL